MKQIRFAFFVICLLVAGPLVANPIFFQLENLGAERWEFSYTVANEALLPVEEFTIFFELGLYENLEITGSPSLDWDGIAAVPDPLLVEDGFADWLALGPAILPGDVQGGFSVAFDWLGQGLPGSQYFEVVDPLDFSLLSAGFTAPLLADPPVDVPEPSTALLLTFGLLALVPLRRRRRSKSSRVAPAAVRVSYLIFTGVLVQPFGTLQAAPSDIIVGERTLVSKQRVGRAHVDYTFTIEFTNPAEPLTGVIGTVVSRSSNTEIVEGAVVIGDLGAVTVRPSDTFTLRQNRRVRFNPNDLEWQFVADEPLNQAPVARAGEDQSVAQGTSVQLDGRTSSDPDADPLSYFWVLTTPVASAAVLDDPFAAAPAFTADLPGSYIASLVVNDGAIDSFADEVEVTVVFSGDGAPAIVSVPVTSASRNDSYRYDVNAIDPDEGDSLTYVLQLAPPGMTIDPSSGLINWIPTASGAADVDVLVTDSTGRTDRQIFLVQVNSGSNDLPPVLSPLADQSVQLGASLSVIASGSDPEGEALRYSIASGPAGLVINSLTGELRWRPDIDQVGAASAIVVVSDPGGQSATTGFNINVFEERLNSAPSIAPIADRTVQPLERIQMTLSATDPDPEDVLTFELFGAPTGLVFDARTGVLSWVPDAADAGTRSLTARVFDASAASDEVVFSITVAEPSLPPVAVDDAFTVRRRDPLTVLAPGVLLNDEDPNGDVLAALQVSETTLGTISSFPGDGGFGYQPPPLPPIEIGLVAQCETLNAGFRAFYGTVPAADIDRDGDIELVGFSTSGFTSEFRVFDATNCVEERSVSIGPRPGQGTIFAAGLVTSPVFANLDADPELEVVVMRRLYPTGGGDGTHMVALNPDGSFVWGGDAGSETSSFDRGPNSGQASEAPPIVTDLDGDGSVELILVLDTESLPGSFQRSGIVVYNADGTIRWEFETPPYIGDSDGKPVLLVDLDLDGTLEVVFHDNVISHAGSLEFTLDTPLRGTLGSSYLTLAPGNFDTDPFPELLARDQDTFYLFEHTGAVKWSLPGQRVGQATSEFTVADFDGDGAPEFAIVALLDNNRYGLAAYEADGTELWNHLGRFETTLVERGPSATAFDFDQDGADELVMFFPGGGTPLATERGLYVFSGLTGEALAFVADDDVGKSFMYRPTVLDVDGDGAAEVLFSGLVGDQVRILEGLPGNAFAPARPIWNQWAYQPTHVSLDGTVVAAPQPQWLIPGLNSFNAAATIPFEQPELTDQFRYLANDGNSDSNEATVSIAVADVNAPTIVSTPAPGASPGFAYRYGVLVTDADFGDSFTYTLLQAPSGMSISTLGLLEWTPDAEDLGMQQVSLVVTDSQGNTGMQTFELTISPPVPVPDVLGSNAADASAALVSAGLTPGRDNRSVQPHCSCRAGDQPEYRRGESSAAGAFVELVLSLGPQPIFVPELRNLSEAVAVATLEQLGLAPGAVSFSNSTSVPKGLVIAQSIAPQTEVPFESAVDLTVSGGPALTVAIDATLVAPEQPLSFTVARFDATGAAQPLPDDLTIAVSADAGATGTVPVVNGYQLLTAADTRGSYELQVTSASIGGEAAQMLIVAPMFAANGVQASYADVGRSIDALQVTYGQLSAALRTGDLLTIPTLAAQLVAIRAMIDADDLQLTPPVALETGFLPTGLLTPPTSGDEAFATNLATFLAALRESRQFLERLDPVRARNDDVRARFLNELLEADSARFIDTDLTLNSPIAGGYLLYELLSRETPRLLLADIDATLGLLGEAGLLVDHLRPGAYFAQQAAPSHLGQAFDEQEVFFTLGGMASASSIRMDIVKRYYFPIVKKLVAASQNIVAQDLLRRFTDVGDLGTVVTGASLSFNSFNLGHAIIEADTAAIAPAGNIVLLIGPTLVADLAGVLNSLNGLRFNSMREAKASVETVRETAQSAIDTINKDFKQIGPGETSFGCVFSNESRCRQLGFSDGLPTVYHEGDFPAPVLIVLFNAITGELSLNSYLFFASPEPGE